MQLNSSYFNLQHVCNVVKICIFCSIHSVNSIFFQDVRYIDPIADPLKQPPQFSIHVHIFWDDTLTSASRLSFFRGHITPTCKPRHLLVANVARSFCFTYKVFKSLQEYYSGICKPDPLIRDVILLNFMCKFILAIIVSSFKILTLYRSVTSISIFRYKNPRTCTGHRVIKRFERREDGGSIVSCSFNSRVLDSSVLSGTGALCDVKVLPASSIACSPTSASS